MTNLLRVPTALMLCGLMALSACGDKKSAKAPDAGGSQVIARVNGEEITVHQLNAELANIPQAGQDQKEIQKEVLRAIVFRTMLRQEAVKAGLDKNQQLQLLIDGAKDKILADAYVSSQTGSTPPPTSTEVNEYIASNPLQFGERRIYQFQRLTMPVDKYSNELVPMFDQKETFDEFQNYLNGKSIPYTLAEVRLPSTDFPKQVQDELVKFGVGDNVVVRGQQSIVILKIKSWVDMPVEQQDAEKIAQNALHQQSQQQRARSLRDQMAHSGKVEFLGEFSGISLDEPKPAQPATPPAGAAPKPDTQTTPAPGATPAPTGAPADVTP